VVREPEEIEANGFEWDEVNLQHVADHGLAPHNIEYARLNNPLYFRNLEGRGGTHVMIGVDDRGWSLYVPLAETDVPGRWR
jgi:hypothetical protein